MNPLSDARPGDGEEGPSPSDADLALMALLDGELDAAAAERVEKQLRADRAYQAQFEAMSEVGLLVREQAGRVYAAGRVDSIADRVMRSLATDLPANDGAAAEDTDAPPATSRQVRRRKNFVVWAVVIPVAAAAGVLAMFVATPHGGRSSTASHAESPSSRDDRVAKGPATQPLDPGSPHSESGSVEVEDLEVGEGATVIYLREGSSPAVVMVNPHREDSVSPDGLAGPKGSADRANGSPTAEGAQ